MTRKNGSGKITPEVSKKHISERVGGSYPTAKAIEALEEAVELGYGTMDVLHPTILPQSTSR